MLLLLLTLGVLGNATLLSMNLGSPIAEAHLSQDGSTLCVRTLDDRIYVLTKGGASIYETAYSTGLKSLAVSGDYFGVGDIEGNLHIYKRDQIVYTKNVKNAVSSISISENAQKIAFSHDTTLEVVSDFKTTTSYNLGDYIYSTSISEDGGRIAAGLSNGTLVLLTQNGVEKEIDMGNLIRQVVLTDNLLGVRTTKKVAVLSVSGERLFEEKINAKSMAISPEADIIAIAGDTLSIYTISGNKIAEIDLQAESIDLSRKGDLLLVTTWKGDLLLFNTTAIKKAAVDLINKEKPATQETREKSTEIEVSPKPEQKIAPQKIVNKTEVSQKKFGFKVLLLAFIAGLIISTMSIIYFNLKK